MRRLLTVLACTALAVGSAAPVWADAKAQPSDQPITAMGGHEGGGDRRGHGDGDGWRGHRGHDRDDDRGYDRHNYRYDRYYYGCGYYGCGYDGYYDGYYGGGYYDG